MKKKILFLSIFLLLLSFFIVGVLGRKSTVKFDLENLNNVTYECDNKIINCDSRIDDNYLTINITPKKKSKTIIKVYGERITENNKIEVINKQLNIYVHTFGIITTKYFFGHVNGDISFHISFYIIILSLIIYLIKQYKIDTKNNFYSYKNARLLGLILFIIISFLLSLFIYVYDFYYGYESSIFALFDSMQDYILFTIIFSYPLVFIVSILVMISNIKLLKKEGKNWKNMLGIYIGTFLFLMIIFIIVNGSIYYSNNTFNMHVYYYFFNLIVAFITYLECNLTGIIILSIKAARHIPKFDKDGIIILGCQIKSDGTLTNLLKSRVDRAIEFSKMQREATGKELYFIPSGGKGSDEIISEGEAIKNYLISTGINENKILIENKSKNTYENIKYSYNIIKKKIDNPNIAFSTTNYHVFRAGVIASSMNIKVEGIGSKTKSYYWVNAFIREFVASIVSEKKGHLKMMLIIAIILLIYGIMSYFALIL